MAVLGRLRELPPELRNASLAATALALTLLLPWYQQSFAGSDGFVQRNVSAFGVFTFVEAAVLLVAGAVLFLVWTRSENKGFHLPGGDGTVIALAGGWAVLLLVWRLFDKPDAPNPDSGSYGIQWGMFAALLAAGVLLAAGLRLRAAHRPEPPNPAADAPGPSEPRPPRRRADPAAVTEVLGERPDWSGEPPEAPRRARRAEPPPPDEAPTRRSDEAPTRKIEDDRLF